MSNNIEAAIAKIRSIGDEYCENQMYVWPDFDPMAPDPDAFFERQEIEFDGILFIRYPVRKTFNPLSIDQLQDEERSLGVALPNDYKTLLRHFGALHLPGDANIAIEAPTDALESTRSNWCYEGEPLSALAVSPYNATSDGNSIGFVRQGDSFDPAVYEFDHELRYKGNDPALWTRKVGDSLADFLLEYLDRNL